jgi:hypothetical protein
MTTWIHTNLPDFRTITVTLPMCPTSPPSIVPIINELKEYVCNWGFNPLVYGMNEAIDRMMDNYKDIKGEYPTARDICQCCLADPTFPSYESIISDLNYLVCTLGIPLNSNNNVTMTKTLSQYKVITGNDLPPNFITCPPRLPPARALPPARVPIFPGTPVITIGNISTAGTSQYNVPVRWTSTNASGYATVSVSPVDSMTTFTPATSPGLNGSRNYVLQNISTTSTKTYTITVTTISSTGQAATASGTVVIPKRKAKKGGTRRKLKKSRKSKKLRK